MAITPQVKEELKEAAERGILTDKIIAATGKFEDIIQIQKILNEYQISIDYIVDNDRNKVDLQYDNIPIKNPNEIMSETKDRILLIYSPKYYRNMKAQYSELGLDDEREIFVLGEEKAETSIQKICKGYFLAQKIREKYSKDTTIYICRGPIGDFYLLQLFFKQFLAQENIKDYVLVGDSKGFNKVGCLFPDNSYEVLASEETENLIRWAAYYDGQDKNIKILTIWLSGLSGNLGRYVYHRKYHFLDMIRSYALGLSEDVKPEFPIFPQGNPDFEKMGLVRGKTVVIAPFSYSVCSLPLYFWQQICDRLKVRGYHVIINVGGLSEQGKFRDVQDICVDIVDMVDLLEYAGYFISIRSGLCDVTVSARCKKIILYPEMQEEISLDWHRMDYEFNSLKRMGINEDSIEIKYHIDSNGNFNKEDIREKILIEF